MIMILAAEAAAAVEGRDFSILGLIRHADPVVQGIMALLVLASVACWAVMIEKWVRLRRLRKDVGTLETLELMYPPVTALRYNFHQSASAAVQLILQRIEKVAPPHARTVVIQSDLILGASCGAV